MAQEAFHPLHQLLCLLGRWHFVWVAMALLLVATVPLWIQSRDTATRRNMLGLAWEGGEAGSEEAEGVEAGERLFAPLDEVLAAAENPHRRTRIAEVESWSSCWNK